ncbi:MAG TPA: ankyrin repeat domain-containing protein [Syntrophorhabdaceae bacterium]|nr:ankyrin repeat domain-containing protein [Syntrophorhabdaceae bacterium]
MKRQVMKIGRHLAVVIGVLALLVLPGGFLAWADTNGLDQALLEASAKGDLAVVRSLLEKGADVNARTDMGETALHLASSEEVVRVLIEHGADVNATDAEYGMTPLFNQRIAVARLLVEKGADVNARSKKGVTPLMWAVYWDAVDKAGFLVEKGADVNARDEHMRTPLHVAANWNKKELADFLLSHRADVNARDASGWTPLHWAAFEGGPEVAEVLLSRGADTTVRSTRDRMIFPAGSTPVDVAKRAKNGGMADYLLNVDRTKEGTTR